jgi:hypothetical protein
MMSRLLPIVLAPALLLAIVACTEPFAPDASRPAASLSPDVAVAQRSAENGTLTEPAAYNGRICELRFPGTPSRTAEWYAIWNLGHGILDEPFNTERPDLYAIIPGTMHTNPDYPQLDHDHIVSAAPGVPGYNGTWDVWVVVPGANFDLATYTAPRSVESMLDLIAQGILAGPFSFSQAGFGPDLVVRAPFVCTEGE